MSVIALFLMVLMQLQIPLFIVALAGGMGAPYLAQKGDLGKARVAAWAAFIAASLLCVLYLGGIMLALRAGSAAGIGIDLLMCGLWGYFAWRDYRVLQMLRGRS